ncbi:hypothetical protein QBC41DRAFT_103547 [Cercophora samala]|uniref:Uncharacterized protein n=1 Tax=Cercophora samala TaxID=330535 RepID=A0AA40DEC1_9PEZI|nr:hypothetical protein QBC41DRAFT_103547 [Cercophora samala]
MTIDSTRGVHLLRACDPVAKSPSHIAKFQQEQHIHQRIGFLPTNPPQNLIWTSPQCLHHPQTCRTLPSEQKERSLEEAATSGYRRHGNKSSVCPPTCHPRCLTLGQGTYVGLQRTKERKNRRYPQPPLSPRACGCRVVFRKKQPMPFRNSTVGEVGEVVSTCAFFRLREEAFYETFQLPSSPLFFFFFFCCVWSIGDSIAEWTFQIAIVLLHWFTE